MPQPEVRANFRRWAKEPHHIAPPSHSADIFSLGALGEQAAAERAKTCSVPNNPEGRPGAHWARDDASRAHQGSNDGWRPGAKWARRDMVGDTPATRAQVEAAVARLPAHQRPPMREMGRRSEPASHPFKLPFKPMTPDEAGTSQLALWATMPAVRYPGEGPRPPADPNEPYPGEGCFFLTGRMTGSVVARACPENGTMLPMPRHRDDSAPVVTAMAVDGRMEVVAASAAARALGALPGVVLTQARATIPGLVILPAEHDGDRAALHRLAIALARSWAPVVMISGEEGGGAAGLFIDLTGVVHLHGGEEAFARRLGRLLARMGFSSHVAIADTPGAAWALARFGGQSLFLCPPGMQEKAIRALPVPALRLEPSHVELLRRLGVDTVGELARLPRAPLARRFGGALVRRMDQATGRAPEPLDPIIPPEHIVVRQHFAEPIGSAEAIEHWLGRLAPRLCDALARAGRGARSIELVAERVDGVPQIIRVGLARPVRDPAHLLRLLARRIEEIAPGFGLDSLALHVRRSDPLGSESLAPELSEEAAPDLAPLVDLIANRIGESRLWRVRPVESDVPERAVILRPPLDPPERAGPQLRADDVRQLAVAEDDHPWHRRWPRPARLLPRPEPVEHVLAELPDQPPKRFTWRGTSHRIVRADGPERVTGEWWLRPAERDAVRDYYSVEDEAGRRFWLFRRGDGVRKETGDLSWHLHGTFG